MSRVYLTRAEAREFLAPAKFEPKETFTHVNNRADNLRNSEVAIAAELNDSTCQPQADTAPLPFVACYTGLTMTPHRPGKEAPAGRYFAILPSTPDTTLTLGVQGDFQSTTALRSKREEYEHPGGVLPALPIGGVGWYPLDR